MAPPIPLRPLGVPLGLCAPGRTPTVKIELFQDLCCPFSAKMQKVICTEVGPELKKLGEKGETRYDGVEFLFQNVAQPWHPQSCVMNEVSLALLQALGNGNEKFWMFSLAVMEKRNVLFEDHQTCHLTRRDLHKVLLEVGKESGVLSDDDCAKIECVLKEVEQKDGFNEVIKLMKFQAKYHRIRGVHVTPTVFINDVEAPDISSGWTKDQWIEKLQSVCQ